MTQKHVRGRMYLQRASVQNLKGSLTVEAALITPFFIYAVVCLIYLFEIQAVLFTLRGAAQNAAQEEAGQIAAGDTFSSARFKGAMGDYVGVTRLEKSMIEGGSSGLHCADSSYEEATGILSVEVNYRIRLPVPQFTHLCAEQRIAFFVKAWTGYTHTGFGEDEETVYITETGTVYHEDYHCTHLQLSIQPVNFDSVASLRNDNGGKYHACEKCVHGQAEGQVYITNEGDRYHTSLGCSGLKRSVQSVKKSEVSGRGACTRCSQ